MVTASVAAAKVTSSELVAAAFPVVAVADALSFLFLLYFYFFCISIPNGKRSTRHTNSIKGGRSSSDRNGDQISYDLHLENAILRNSTNYWTTQMARDITSSHNTMPCSRLVFLQLYIVIQVISYTIMFVFIDIRSIS